MVVTPLLWTWQAFEYRPLGLFFCGLNAVFEAHAMPIFVLCVLLWKRSRVLVAVMAHMGVLARISYRSSCDIFH